MEIWVISEINKGIGSSWPGSLNACLERTTNISFEPLERCQISSSSQGSSLPISPSLPHCLSAVQGVQMLFSFLLSALFSTSFTTSNNALKKELWCLLSDEKWQFLGNLFMHIDRKAVISGWHLSLCSHEIYCRWMEQLRSNFLVTIFNRYKRKCPGSPLKSYIIHNFWKCSQ